MAGIGLYGVYYSKATLTDGIVTGYNGLKTMGKAISATFEPNDGNENVLYANNGIAEKDPAATMGGNLTLTLDKLTQDSYVDLFGLTLAQTVISAVTGEGFDYDGTEIVNPCGVAFIRWAQEENNRQHYQAVIYSYVTFSPPSDSYQTLGETVEWQTPEISGIVSGGAVTGAKPWKKVYDFPDQATAIAFVTAYFSA